MLSRIDPLEASLDTALASGIETWDLRLGKAVLSQMRGKPDVALENLEKAAFRTFLSPDQMDNYFEVAGWTGDPVFEDVRKRHREYMEAAGATVLSVACGPDGFEIWTPSREDCGQRRTPPVPN